MTFCSVCVGKPKGHFTADSISIGINMGGDDPILEVFNQIIKTCE